MEAGCDAAEPTVERTGYAFGGWDTAFTNITADTIITAIWQKCYEITFNAAGGSIVSGSEVQTLAEGAMPEAPTVERDGFTFTGWDKDIAAVTGDTEYVAQWEADSMDASQVYEAISGSVVEIRLYDQNGEWSAVGSGFFIDTEGTIATNYHVIDGAYTASVLTYDGNEYDVTGVVDYDESLDLAILTCSKTDTVPLTLSTREIKSGETIYTLGSSLGETNTFSTGIVSNPSRIYDGEEFIQITAPISSGNSGGPLVNEYGEVIGINSWQYTDGQNMNYAIHITEIDNLDLTAAPKAVSDVYAENYSGTSSSDNNQAYTIVSNDNDPGTYVYSIADYIEYESNDTFDTSNPLYNGCWTAGYCTEEDADGYTFTITEEPEAYFLVACYYTDDDEYIWAQLFDENTDFIADLILEQDEDGYWYSYITLQPGTYYIGIGLDDGYPYSVGSYYLVGGVWES